MAKITSLKAGKKQQNKVNLFLNGKFTVNLEAGVAVKEGLQVGQELSADHLEEIKTSDRIQRCLGAANQFLGYRQRSEAELRDRLQRRGFDIDSIDAVINKLEKHGLVDDVAFAQFWQENRSAFSPRSKWLTRQELRRKGVNDEIIEQIVETSDDTDAAHRAAVSKLRRLPLSDHQTFRRRLGDFLHRRGFTYETINHVVEQLWQEHGGGSK